MIDIAFYDTLTSPTRLNETGTAGTFEPFAMPTGPGEVQTVTTYVRNIGTDPLPTPFVRARVPLYNAPEPSDLDAWRENIELNILPYVQFSTDGITYSPMGDPHPLLALVPLDPRTIIYVRYTSATTDARTGLPYDYSPGANDNDYPFAYTLEVYGEVSQVWQWGTIIGL